MLVCCDHGVRHSVRLDATPRVLVAEGGVTPATIMLIEDDAHTRAALRAVLEKRGHAVLEARDGASALSLLSAHSVDLILQELTLPDMDGVDLAARLRALPHGGSAPILAWSSADVPLAKARAESIGIDELVSKPIEMSRLLPLIDAHLAKAFKRASRVATRSSAVEDEDRDRQTLLRVALDSVGDAVITLDAHGNVLQLNRAAIELTGWSQAEAKGRPVRELFELLNERTRMPLEMVPAADGDPDTSPARSCLLVSRSGLPRPIMAHEVRLRAADDQLQGTVLVFRDLTESREAAGALRRSERLYRATFEQAGVGMARLSTDGRWLDVNQRLCDIVGYTANKLLTKTVDELIYEPDLESHAEQVELALAGGTRSYAQEKRYVRPDGELVWVDVTTTLVRSTSGHAEYFIKIIQDISRRKHAEEELENTAAQLRQSQKMEAIGQLAGGVAHDFNNVLSVIRGHSEMLLDDLARDNPARPEVQEIVYACERASNLTRQLLVLSRKQVIAPRFVDINETTEALSKMLRRLIGEDIELTLDLAAKGRVVVDPGQLEQALINLVVNARDAMLQGGTLSIRTLDVAPSDSPPELGLEDEGPGSVLVSVTDTGVGMSAELQTRIFEPFFTTKEPGRGTGLGLSTVFGFMKQSNGEVTVTSEVGKGTTFHLYFPCGDGAEHTSMPPSQSPVLARATETVLLVEDDDQVRAVAKAILERGGYTVLEAASCDEALRCCRQLDVSIDVLLTDVVMPSMSGRNLAERVKAGRPSVKVVFMSGYTDDGVVKAGALTAGIAFVQKPLSVTRLLGTLREVLQTPAG